jgi:hypothetical protein
MRAQLERDFVRFGGGLPGDFPSYVRDIYRIDLSARYLGVTIPHPIGKGSGQLSLKEEQLVTDADAGLAFVVLKTVIAQDERGEQSMSAWAIHESRMQVERRVSHGGRTGWTVTWKGRGWDRSFDDYLTLVRTARDLSRQGRILAVPSVKYHLPRLGEEFRKEEYRFTTGMLARAWPEEPLLLEKDFSPTLAGDELADERERIMRWISEVPGQIRGVIPGVPVRIALKLMNTRFDDDFQAGMLARAAEGGADGATVFNRLFDPVVKTAYGGWDLSERNLRVLALCREQGVRLPLSGTGNIGSGQMILAYAQAGCESVQLHTFFQLPLSEYPATAGSRTSRALHALVFHPSEGLIAGMLELEHKGRLHRTNGELRFLDLCG